MRWGRKTSDCLYGIVWSNCVENDQNEVSARKKSGLCELQFILLRHMRRSLVPVAEFFLTKDDKLDCSTKVRDCKRRLRLSIPSLELLRNVSKQSVLIFTSYQEKETKSA